MLNVSFKGSVIIKNSLSSHQYTQKDTVKLAELRQQLEPFAQFFPDNDVIELETDIGGDSSGENNHQICLRGHATVNGKDYWKVDDGVCCGKGLIPLNKAQDYFAKLPEKFFAYVQKHQDNQEFIDSIYLQK